MAINPLDPVSSAIVNAAFMSKTDDTSAAGAIDHTKTTDSSSSTTGAFKTAGGMGVAKKLYVGTDLSVGNNLTLGAKQFIPISNISTAGANQTLTPPSFLGRLTGALTSIVGLTASSGVQILILSNATGSTITIKNDTTATAANRIITGSGADISMLDGSSLFFAYDSTSSRWRIIGSSAAPGANQSLSNLTSPTSVNQDLIPAADNTQKLGSSLKTWADLAVVTISIGGVTAIDISGNILYDGGGRLSADWNNRFLHDTANLLALNWNNRKLYASDGSSVMLDWHLPGKINASTNLITNVLDPVNSQDAATKAYVDAIPQGLKNYISNSGAETSTSGWAAYADAAGTSPVNGTGGSPTVTITRSTSSPLRDVGSFLITKDAANRQGEGVSYDFTIDVADKCKVLGISFDYIVNSGTFVAGSDSAASDVTVWIYDVTNSALIQPSSYKLFSNSSSLPSRFIANFQTSTSTSYRLIFHVGSTSASAYAIKFDNVQVTPTVYTIGTPITDWTDGGAIGITSTGGGAVKGTTTRDKVFYRRIGNNLEVRMEYRQSGAGTVGTGEYLFAIPGSLSMDSSLVSFLTGDYQVSYNAVGYGKSSINGVAGYGGIVVPYDATHVRLFNDATSSLTTYNPVGNGWFPLSDATVSYTLSFSVPIQGWASSVLMSDFANTAQSYLELQNMTNTGSTPYKIPVFGTIVKNVGPAMTYTSSSVNGDSITINEPGLYMFVFGVSNLSSGMVGFTKNETLASTGNTGIDSVSTAQGRISIANSDGAQCVYLGYLSPNDVIRPHMNANGVTTSDRCYLQAAKINSFSGSIAATETIACAVGGDPASASSGNPIIFPTVSYDTHAAYNASTGRYTCAAAGLYKVYGYINSGNSAIKLSIYVDAVSTKDVGSTDSNGECNYIGSIRCTSGQIIDLRPNGTLDANSGSTIHIERFS